MKSPATLGLQNSNGTEMEPPLAKETGPKYSDFNNLDSDQLAVQKFNIINNDPVGHILIAVS